MPLVRKPAATANKDVPQSLDVLKALRHDDSEQRWTAARNAAAVEGGSEALIAALPIESNARVREAILTSLTRIGSVQGFDAIAALLRSDDAGVRASVLDALRAMMGTHYQRLPELLRDSDRDVRILSCELARSLPSAEATQMLCAVLNQESDANVCAAAIDVLAEMGSSDALTALTQCAGKFSDKPFLLFAIKVATDRIVAQSTVRHV